MDNKDITCLTANTVAADGLAMQGPKARTKDIVLTLLTQSILVSAPEGAIFLTTFSNVFYWWKMCVFLLIFDWSL